MRTTRALIAGIGTTGSLVAAAACAALLASAVISFSGWSGAGIGTRVDGLFVDDSVPIVYDLPGPQVIAADAVAAAGDVSPIPVGAAFVVPAGGGPGGGGTPGDGPIRGVPVTVGPGGIVTVPGRGPGSGGAGSGGSGELPGLPETPGAGGLGDTITGAGRGLGDTVTNTTGALGNTVAPVSPQLGSTITGTGRGLGDTVTNTTRGLGSAP